jgi:hypothetical protein
MYVLTHMVNRSRQETSSCLDPQLLPSRLRILPAFVHGGDGGSAGGRPQPDPFKSRPLRVIERADSRLDDGRHDLADARITRRGWPSPGDWRAGEEEERREPGEMKTPCVLRSHADRRTLCHQTQEVDRRSAFAYRAPRAASKGSTGLGSRWVRRWEVREGRRDGRWPTGR